jgi:hypothetical protein
LFELEGKGPSREKELNQRVEMLEQKLAKKDGVIAEITFSCDSFCVCFEFGKRWYAKVTWTSSSIH